MVSQMMVPVINFFYHCAVQALRVELVPYLLKLLEGVGLETLENPSAIKAQIVKALKSMTRSLQFGEQVCVKYVILNNNLFQGLFCSLNVVLNN